MSNDHPSNEHDEVIAATQRWLEKVVIGLNLCPFAKAVHVKKQIRYVVSNVTTAEDLQKDLIGELKALHQADPACIDTTLLIHPNVLTDFFEYNDFLAVADACLTQLGYEGEYQIASFHPQYQFADTTADDITNCTNRSPYPMLHLLREASIDRATEAFPDAGDIFNVNMETMHRLGHGGWAALVAAISPSRNK